MQCKNTEHAHSSTHLKTKQSSFEIIQAVNPRSTKLGLYPLRPLFQIFANICLGFDSSFIYESVIMYACFASDQTIQHSVLLIDPRPLNARELKIIPGQLR